MMTEKALILTQISQGFDQRSWHGTNLSGSLRGLTPEVAAWRPGPGRHNIWELIVHCAYWKYIVMRRITGDARGSFALEGSNFIVRPEEMSVKALKADIRMLKAYHLRLLEVVSALKPALLDTKPVGSTMTVRDTLIGIAAHDLYHAGQIQLLKRLYQQQ